MKRTTPGISDEGLRRIAQAADVDAGFLGDVGRGIRDLTVGKPDYGQWTGQLRDKLEDLEMSIFDLDKNDLIWWHEDGYSVDQAVQLAIGGV